MQFLKTLFWVALAIALVLFASVNWTTVTINLWGGLQADVKLPVLVLGSFLAGFLPLLILHRARTWSLRRRLDGLERQTSTIVPPPIAPSETATPPEPQTALAP